MKDNNQNDNIELVRKTDELRQILTEFKENPFRLNGTVKKILDLFCPDEEVK